MGNSALSPLRRHAPDRARGSNGGQAVAQLPMGYVPARPGQERARGFDARRSSVSHSHGTHPSDASGARGGKAQLERNPYAHVDTGGR